MEFSLIIARNRFKSFCVILTYIFIFFLIGFLVDIIRIDASSLSSGFYELISLQAMPTASITMAVIASSIVFFSITNFSSIMLAGNLYKEITHKQDSTLERKIFAILESLTKRANLHFIPKLYIIDAPYMNAFASGWNEKNSLIALTTTLIQKLDMLELEAVIAHELSHIRHGDIRLTLCVGVLSNILLLVSNWVVFLFLGKTHKEGANLARNILFILQFILPIFTLLLQMYLSRTREYMADSGAAWLMKDPKPLIRALQKIEQNYAQNDYSKIDSNPTRQAAYIFSDALSTHPSTKNRIATLLGKYY